MFLRLNAFLVLFLSVFIAPNPAHARQLSWSVYVPVAAAAAFTMLGFVISAKERVYYCKDFEYTLSHVTVPVCLKTNSAPKKAESQISKIGFLGSTLSFLMAGLSLASVALIPVFRECQEYDCIL